MVKPTLPKNSIPFEGDFNRANDADAGIETTENFEPFSQRNDAFCRSRWDKALMSDAANTFFASYENGASSRKGDGFSQKDFAFRNASWAVANDYAARNTASRGLREGFLAPLEPSEGISKTIVLVDDKDKMAEEIKHISKMFGAHLVGITDYDERWTYTHRVDARTMENVENTLPDDLKNVIVMGVGMDHDLIKTYPSALGGAAVGLGYSKEVAAAIQVAQYIRNLGYEAVASVNDTALVIPYAIKAGLGEYGRNQMVITPEFGPRLRFSKVFTNMPMAHDAPQKKGVKEFCDICDRCAKACPPKALPFGPPEEGGPNKSNIKGVVKWSADCEKCFGYWTKLQTDCAICLRVCPYNRDYTKFSARLFRKFAGTRFRKLVKWVDDKFFLPERLKPKDWWKDK